MVEPDARTSDLDRLVEKLAKAWFTINNPKADPDTPCVSPVAADFVGPAGTHLFKASNIRPAWEFYLTKSRGFAERLYADPEFRTITGREVPERQGPEANVTRRICPEICN